MDVLSGKKHWLNKISMIKHIHVHVVFWSEFFFIIHVLNRLNCRPVKKNNCPTTYTGAYFRHRWTIDYRKYQSKFHLAHPTQNQILKDLRRIGQKICYYIGVLQARHQGYGLNQWSICLNSISHTLHKTLPRFLILTNHRKLHHNT